MDYNKQPLRQKLKKVLRYCRLYGIGRTYIKVRSQKHLSRIYDTLPLSNKSARESQSVAIIGCGNYAYSTIAYYLHKHRGNVFRSCYDIDANRAASLFEDYRFAQYVRDPREIYMDPGVKLVYISSNHSSHAEYAVGALSENKSVFIEKPHVVNESQLARLVDAMMRSRGKVFLGFNRRASRFGRIISDVLDREQGPGMYNWFVVGHQLDKDHWYFKPEEGGRVIGNLCHWSDHLLSIVKKAHPIRIRALGEAASASDVIVTYAFADGTLGVITFSCKGNPFEGIRERFSGHKGNCLVSMDDFQTLKVEIADKKTIYRNFYRDQGHKANILAAFDNVVRDGPYDREKQCEYIWNTGMLFLKTREALETGNTLILDSFDMKMWMGHDKVIQ